jgi:hypothetical protein
VKRELQREREKWLLVEGEREKERLKERERDALREENRQLKDKVGGLVEVIRISWEEHQWKISEAEALIEELQTEN